MTGRSMGMGLEEALAKREEERANAVRLIEASEIVTTVLEKLEADPSGDGLLAHVMEGMKAGRTGYDALVERSGMADTALAQIMGRLDEIARALASESTGKGSKASDRSDEVLRRLSSIERQLSALGEAGRPSAPREPTPGHRELGLFDQPLPQRSTAAVGAKEPAAVVPPAMAASPAVANAPSLPATPRIGTETSTDEGGGTGSRGPRERGRANDVVEVLALCARTHGRPVTFEEIKESIEENGLGCIREEKFTRKNFSEDSDEALDKRYDKYIVDVLARYAMRLQGAKGDDRYAYWHGDTPLPVKLDPAFKSVYLPRNMQKQAKSKIDDYNNCQKGDTALGIVWRKAEGAAAD